MPTTRPAGTKPKGGVNPSGQATTELSKKVGELPDELAIAVESLSAAVRNAEEAYAIDPHHSDYLILSRLASQKAEIVRWHSAYEIAHDQASQNGAEANRLRATVAAQEETIRALEWALKPFGEIGQNLISGSDRDEDPRLIEAFAGDLRRARDTMKARLSARQEGSGSLQPSASVPTAQDDGAVTPRSDP